MNRDYKAVRHYAKATGAGPKTVARYREFVERVLRGAGLLPNWPKWPPW